MINSLAVWTGIGCLLVALPATADPQLLTHAQLEAGWLRLFDGETLYGWQATSDANWHVDGRELVADQGAPGLLLTTTAFSNYVLKLQFRAGSDSNSGIFLHAMQDSTNVARDCYEVNVAGADDPFPTGSLVQRLKASAAPPSPRAAWRTFEIVVHGPRVVVRLDGQQVVDYVDTDPIRRGRIGLQYRSGNVRFRDIMLKPLGMRALFNGRDLTGWRTDQALNSAISVTDEGALHIQNGKGQVETEEAFADFVFRTEIFCNGTELNSGVFFRCIPGDLWMGYESQIHNGFHQNDRNRPSNCGTGGIFRRQDARRVMADDYEWFHMTIVADGSHMAVWVHGIQVSDWTDTRPAHPNPRQGKRLEAGTILLQGHDPTTDLSFRDLSVVEMPQRAGVTGP